MSSDKRKIENYLIFAFARYPIMYNVLCTLFLRTGLECHMCMMMIVTICTGLWTSLMWRPLRFTAGGAAALIVTCARAWAEPAHLLGFRIRHDNCPWTLLRAELNKFCHFFKIQLETLYIKLEGLKVLMISVLSYSSKAVGFFTFFLSPCCWC